MPDTTPDRPSGRELDALVLWAIHRLEPPIYTNDVQFYTALKAGRVGIDDNDYSYYRSVNRSLARLKELGVIETGRADGWQFTEMPK